MARVVVESSSYKGKERREVGIAREDEDKFIEKGMANERERLWMDEG